MFYHNSTVVLYKVIVSVIYSIIDYLDCMGILQHKLSTYNKKFEQIFSMIRLGWVFLRF